MNDRQLDRLLETAALIRDDAITTLDLRDLEVETKELIMSTPVLTPVSPPSAPGSGRHERGIVPRLVAAVAVAAVVVAGIVVMPFGGSDDTAWAAEALAVAEASSRLLVELPGWEVTRAHTFTVAEGEMTFSDGNQSLDLHWRPAAEHDGYVADRLASAAESHEVTVNGRRGVLVRYLDSFDFTTLWRDGRHSYEARGVFPDRAAYEAVLAALTPTDVDTWLRAMPESVVRPIARAAAVAEMIADMPLPDGFDVGAVGDGRDVSDRYQLGAAVSGAVACGWIGQWLDSRTSGDTAAEAEALEAMQTSRNWAILLEMEQSGAYPQVLWLHVDAMEADDRVPDVISVRNYRQALGC